MINLNQHFSYQDIVMYLQMLADQFPEFTIYRSIGISHDEREIPMMRIGFSENDRGLLYGLARAQTD